jgi:hypothetical protein
MAPSGRCREARSLRWYSHWSDCPARIRAIAPRGPDPQFATRTGWLYMRADRRFARDRMTCSARAQPSMAGESSAASGPQPPFLRCSVLDRRTLFQQKAGWTSAPSVRVPTAAAKERAVLAVKVHPTARRQRHDSVHIDVVLCEHSRHGEGVLESGHVRRGIGLALNRNACDPRVPPRGPA